MKMRQKNITRNVKKQNEGITLIALVITIIVLLILAGVTIATLTGDNGLLSKATTAKNTANDAEIGEKIRLAYQDYYLGQHTQGEYSFQDALDKIFGTGVATASGPDSNGVYTVSVNGKTYTFNPATKELTLVSSSSSTAWTDNGDGTYTAGTQTIAVGDYVNYDPTEGATTGLTYTSEAATNGYEDQSFNAATYKSAGYRWRVLDIKNGKIRLISEEYVGPGNYSDQSRTTYYLQGQAGYINGISELNNISAIFGHGKGAESATSITVDDINGITGFNPNSPKYQQGNWDEYGNTVTYTKQEDGTFSSSSTNELTWSFNIGSNTMKYYNGTSFVDLTGSTTIESTNYSYGPLNVNSNYITGNANQDGTLNVNDTYKMLFGVATVGNDYQYRTFTNGNGLNYWLASKAERTTNSGAYWNIFCVTNTCYVSNNSLYSSLYNPYVSNPYDLSNSENYGVRPVVSLKSDVQLEANGNNNWNIK